MLITFLHYFCVLLVLFKNVKFDPRFKKDQIWFLHENVQPMFFSPRTVSYHRASPHMHCRIQFNLLFPVRIGSSPSLHSACLKLVCMKLRGEWWEKIKNKKSALRLPPGHVSRSVYQTHKSNFKMVFGSYKHMTLKLDRYAALKAIPCFTLSHGWLLTHFGPDEIMTGVAVWVWECLWGVADVSQSRSPFQRTCE